MIGACDTLNARLAPVKAKLGGDKVAWKDLIAAAAAEGVCLSAEGWFAPQATTSDPFQYYIWCAGLCVVEVDVLTGEVLIPHTEIVYDCGQSLNPLVDIGQIEGGACVVFFLPVDRCTLLSVIPCHALTHELNPSLFHPTHTTHKPTNSLHPGRGLLPDRGRAVRRGGPAPDDGHLGVQAPQRARHPPRVQCTCVMALCVRCYVCANCGVPT